MNRRALDLGLRTALALHCEIQTDVRMDRKNYTYPDLPKNYQITQYDRPIGEEGHLPMPEEEIDLDRVGIQRVHMEEDAGKMIHGKGNVPEAPETTKIDFNRAGVPLLEIVSAPDLETPGQARRYLERLRRLLEYIGVSDCDMEKGQLRCDTNISVSRKEGEQGTRAEIKNINSFRNVQKALRHERDRQIQQLTSGGTVEMETRSYNEESGETESMRTKEEAADYRYFPDPDLLPQKLESDRVEEIRRSLPERPWVRRKRYRQEYGLDEEAVSVLVGDRSLGDYFEEVLSHYDEPESVANWILGETLEHLNEEQIDIGAFPVEPEHLAGLAEMFDNGEVTSTSARKIFSKLLETDQTPAEIKEEQNLDTVGDREELAAVVEEVIDENEEPVADYLDGNENAIQALMGQVMRKTDGRAEPEQAMELLREQLEERRG